MFSLGTSGSSSSEISNTIFWNNGEEIVQTDASASVNYSIIDDDTPDGSVSLPAGVTGANNLDSDPLFLDAANNDLRISASSPAFDAGLNDIISMPTDLFGNPRESYTSVDIGVYENQCPDAVYAAATTFFVSSTASDGATGLSWGDPLTLAGCH